MEHNISKPEVKWVQIKLKGNKAVRLDGILIAMQKLVVDFCTDKFTDIIKNYTTVVIDMQVQLDPFS